MWEYASRITWPGHHVSQPPRWLHSLPVPPSPAVISPSLLAGVVGEGISAHRPMIREGAEVQAMQSLVFWEVAAVAEELLAPRLAPPAVVYAAAQRVAKPQASWEAVGVGEEGLDPS